MNGGRQRAPGAGSPALPACSPLKMCSWVLSCCLALQVRGAAARIWAMGEGWDPRRWQGQRGGLCARTVLWHGASRPPVLFPTQHLAVQASLLCTFHLLLLPALPEGQPRAPAAGELLARSLFACGVSALLQTSLGSR